MGSHFYFDNILKSDNTSILEFLNNNQFDILCADLEGDNISKMKINLTNGGGGYSALPSITITSIIISMPPDFLLFPPRRICLNDRKAILVIKAKIPTKTIEMINNLTSLFIICVNSWAITDSNSLSSNLLMIPLESETAKVFSEIPEAKAFKESSSIT